MKMCVFLFFLVRHFFSFAVGVVVWNVFRYSFEFEAEHSLMIIPMSRVKVSKLLE